MAGNRTKRKSWREKLETPAVEGLPKVVDVPEKWQKMMGGRCVLVPTPLMADAEIRTVRKADLSRPGKSAGAWPNARGPIRPAL
jgi:hypothetical protein